MYWQIPIEFSLHCFLLKNSSNVHQILFQNTLSFYLLYQSITYLQFGKFLFLKELRLVDEFQLQHQYTYVLIHEYSSLFLFSEPVKIDSFLPVVIPVFFSLDALFLTGFHVIFFQFFLVIKTQKAYIQVVQS